jgi:multiple sugar transport system ATP-binding protein
VTPFLRLVGLRKSYGAEPALDGIDLQVGGDELLVVLGPTGAGKTTLLRTVAGLEKAEDGQIMMEEQDVSDWEPATRDVAFVFQNFSLYPGWSVRRNLEFPLRAPGRGLAEAEIERRVVWAAQLLRLEGLLERPAERLSGGEMQRVALGRAIVRRPRLFLLDEPLTNLDAKLREILRVELVIIRRRLGIPMVYVTHDQAEALSMGDRVAVLESGRILQIGTPEEVYRHPASPQVARQLGLPQINLLPVHERQGRWVSVDGREIGAATASGRGLLGVRPEDISPENGTSAARVRVVEDTGPAWVLVVEWGETDLRLLVGKGRRYRPGDEVWPSFAVQRSVYWPE